MAIKAIDDLIEAACQGMALKLGAKLGASPKPGSEERDEHGMLSEAGAFPRF
jgi:hypothetical protein